VTADPAKAKSYLEAAMNELGYSAVAQIPEISIVVASSADPRTIVEYVELSLEQELGLKISIDPVEFGVRDSRIISGDYDILYMGWGISNNDPLGYLDVWADDLFATGWPQVDPDSYNAFSALIDRIRLSADMDARAQMLLDAEQLALAKAPFIPLAFSSEVGLIRNQVSGFSLRMFNAPYDYIFASLQ
jgi:ABC-type oligopeptide transport system substrate-binding subunit